MVDVITFSPCLISKTPDMTQILWVGHRLWLLLGGSKTPSKWRWEPCHWQSDLGSIWLTVGCGDSSVGEFLRCREGVWRCWRRPKGRHIHYSQLVPKLGWGSSSIPIPKLLPGCWPPVNSSSLLASWGHTQQETTSGFVVSVTLNGSATATEWYWSLRVGFISSGTVRLLVRHCLEDTMIGMHMCYPCLEMQIILNIELSILEVWPGSEPMTNWLNDFFFLLKEYTG